uniref:Protein HGH1 homolog n=1 Tax=Haptolina brevifila TaxID=156173 RepID=A0A7S2JDS3_9EUKA|mmetsp:Transcript_80835/g.160634  ORF Transcript_80835/g.160634 Transcript_80835/m.160634 type:complete len:138 (+) Transcript_80835:668-1081(+)
MIDRILCMYAYIGAACGATARNHAIKVIEAMSSSEEAQLDMVARNHHVTLLALLGREDVTLYASKTLAATICNLTQPADNAVPLANAGAISALLTQQKGDARLAAAVHAIGEEGLAGLPSAEERALVVELCAEPLTD